MSCLWNKKTDVQKIPIVIPVLTTCFVSSFFVSIFWRNDKDVLIQLFSKFYEIRTEVFRSYLLHSELDKVTKVVNLTLIMSYYF